MAERKRVHNENTTKTRKKLIKFIGNDYLQLYKTLQLFTSSFTLNTNILTSIKVIKTHVHTFTHTHKSYQKCQAHLRLGSMKTFLSSRPNEIMWHFITDVFKFIFRLTILLHHKPATVK